MGTGKIFGFVLLIVGIGLIIFGINSMNSTESQIKDFFGSEDTSGMFSIGIGALLAIVGAVMGFKKG